MTQVIAVVPTREGNAGGLRGRLQNVARGAQPPRRRFSIVGQAGSLPGRRRGRSSAPLPGPQPEEERMASDF